MQRRKIFKKKYRVEEKRKPPEALILKNDIKNRNDPAECRFLSSLCFRTS